jgi:flagellum-specific peptidoglycan hydrolase FlgJ
VLKQGGNAHGFAQALQNSGYATDPLYAEKLVKVIGRVQNLA